MVAQFPQRSQIYLQDQNSLQPQHRCVTNSAQLMFPLSNAM